MNGLSNLLKIMRLAYAMQPEDEQALWQDIMDQRTQAWLDALEDEAANLGVHRRARPPRGLDQQYLQDLSRRDAGSIRRTYNRDLERELQRLYAANPRGNRYYYIRHLEDWATRRAAWKDRQIALYNNKTARHYAQQRFVDMNSTQQRWYRFAGPAPVCGDCADQFAAGEVPQTYVDQHRAPLHPGCPHSWTITQMRVAVALDDLWLGG